LHKETLAMKIGQGGISQGVLTESAYQRTVKALQHFREAIDRHGVVPEKVFATATSAIRSAKNGAQLVAEIEAKTGIRIQVIAGDKEAEYIYYGVKAALSLGKQPSLIMDIGGGSVEFIIGNEEGVFWKRSFEIGAQRLLDLFMPADPIPAQSVNQLNTYLEEKLAPLAEAVKQHQPKVLIGSSGTFDTLIDMHHLHNGLPAPQDDLTEFSLPIDSFFRMHQQLITLNQLERLAIPGMLEMRVDMIVVASCLIQFVLRCFAIPTIRVSTYALKEGVLQWALGRT
jgi:exopolyphosphatase / guanosine-5'-triphosphate,3'-diphosphate pyrophosphatase